MIERKDIERLAELARIRISPEEAESLRGEIDSILGYVGQIDEAAGSADAEPRAGSLRNVMRNDGEPHEPDIYTESLLRESPGREGRHFKVKKILGGSDNA